MISLEQEQLKAFSPGLFVLHLGSAGGVSFNVSMWEDSFAFKRFNCILCKA